MTEQRGQSSTGTGDFFQIRKLNRNNQYRLFKFGITKGRKMKTKLGTLFTLAFLMLAGTVIQANEATKLQTDTASKVTTTAVKLSHKDARKQCLKENPNQKGKDLKDCIKQKLANS